MAQNSSFSESKMKAWNTKMEILDRMMDAAILKKSKKKKNTSPEQS